MPDEFALTAQNLAQAHFTRGLPGDRTRAIALIERSLRIRANRPNRIEWAETNAILATYKTIEAKTSDLAEVTREAARVRDSLRVCVDGHDEATAVRISANFADALFPHAWWPLLIEFAEFAVALAQSRFVEAASYAGKRAELASIHNLETKLAYAYARQGRCEEAAITLDLSQGRWLVGDLLLDVSKQARTLPRTQYEEYRRTIDRMQNAQRAERLSLYAADSLELTRNASVLADELSAAAFELRRVLLETGLGSGTFIATTKSDVASAIEHACQRSALLYLAATELGSFALIACGGGDVLGGCQYTILWLDDIRSDELARLVGGLGITGSWVDALANADEDLNTWMGVLDEAMTWLGSRVMERVVAHCEIVGTDSLVIIPVGLFAVFPLHAAHCGQNTTPFAVVERLVVSYGIAVQLIQIYSGESTAEKRALIVAAPTRGDATFPELPYARPEAYLVAAQFPQPVIISGDDATRDCVLSHIGDSTIAHFACHAVADWREPFRSAIVLAGRQLNTHDLFSVPFARRRLASLSACQSGIASPSRHELISLAAGFIRAGFEGVLATTWSISDVSTCILMQRFYSIWQSEASEPAAALRQAQIWLKGTTNYEKLLYYEKLQSEVAAWTDVDKSELVSALRHVIAALARLPRMEASFSHAHFWGAFRLLGS